MTDITVPTGTITLDLMARTRPDGQEFNVGEIEIPITIDHTEVVADVKAALAETREAARQYVAADLEPGILYFVCGNCRQFTETTDARPLRLRDDGMICTECL